jgi:replicative DNA helicase
MDVERLALGMFFRDTTYMNFIADNFDIRFFEDPNIAHLLKWSIDHYRKHRSRPSANVIQGFINDIISNTSLDKQHTINVFRSAMAYEVKDDANFVEHTIVEFIRRKSLYYAILDNLDDVTSERKDVSKIVERLAKAQGITLDSGTGMIYFDQLDEHFLEMCKPENKLSFGYKDLDWVTNGGVTKKEKSINIIAAPPGLGKSMFLTNFAAHYLEQGLTVFIVSLEMSSTMYASRIDALLANHDINMLKFHAEDCKTSIRNFHGLHPTAKLIIKEWPPSSINALQIKAWIDKLNLLGYVPDVLIVDYLNLMQPNIMTQSTIMYEKVGNIGRELRALSYDMKGVPVWTATQVNRAGCAKGTEPKLDNMSESMGTAHTADFIGSLWCTDEEILMGKMNMTVLKNRWGGKVGTKLRFDVDYNRLKVLDSSDNVGMSDRASGAGSKADLVDTLLGDI